MFKLTTILKGLKILRSDTLTPDSIEIVPNGTASTKTTIQSSQTSDRTITLPNATDTLVGRATTDTLTNKTIDADGTGNSITNIDNDNIKAGAAIDVTKLGAGTVDNTEFGYLDGVTSSIQTQLNNNASASSTVQTNLNNHINDTTDAHDASAISVVPTGGLTSNNVQDALVELQGEISGGASPEIRPAIFFGTPGGTLPDNSDVVFLNMVQPDYSVTLPANPAEGQIIKIIGQNGDIGSEVTVNANVGQLIEGTVLPKVKYQTGFTVRFESTAWTLIDISQDTVPLNLTKISTPATPAANRVKLYPKSDDNLYLLNSSGIERRVNIESSLVLPPKYTSYVGPNSGTHLPTYYFIVNSASANAGAIYSNNSQNFTVSETISGLTLLRTTGTGAPSASGTLTRVSGTGDATITFSQFRAPIQIEIKMVGGGGGGASGGTGGGSAFGNNGVNSTFGTFTANAGAGGNPRGAAFGGAGGTASLGGGIGVALTGANGSAAIFLTNLTGSTGGDGGESPYGGGGSASLGGNTGGNGATGTGSGGGGGGSNAAIDAGGGTGGGAGGFVHGFIYAPFTTYAFFAGGGGTGGLGGGPGGTGGNGGSGLIEVMEIFQ